MKKVKGRIIIGVLAAFTAAVLMSASLKVSAASAGRVTVKGIDYETLEMNIYKNGNGIVYSSLDQKTWNEVEGIVGDKGTDKEHITVDISWASPSANVSMYLKGDVDQTITKIVFPKQLTSFKAVFDKVNGDFTFTGYESQTYFFYRKTTDYNWKKVYFNDLAAFNKDVASLRFKGAKLVFKLGQTAGASATDEDPGERPSKEISVTIPKLASAPVVKINILKLTTNTKDTMEWTDDLNGTWKSCTKNMNVEDFAPAALGKGSKPVTVYFRTAATEKRPCSQIGVLNVPAQGAAPVQNTDFSYAYEDKKLALTFSAADSTNQYEYCIIKKEDSIDKAKWKTVKTSKTIRITAKACSGATFYVRYKGVNENVNKKIELKLPSAYTSFIADGFTE